MTIKHAQFPICKRNTITNRSFANSLRILVNWKRFRTMGG